MSCGSRPRWRSTSAAASGTVRRSCVSASRRPACSASTRPCPCSVQADAIHGARAGRSLGDRLRRWFGAGSAAGAAAASFVAADAARLPLRDSSVDLLWSNLAWHWFGDPVGAAGEFHRVMRPDGLLMFSSFGVDTLRELRRIGAELPDFPDMHDIGDLLGSVGFAAPVMDTERLTVTWSDPDSLLRDLRGLGGNALRARRRSLCGRQRRAQWSSAIETLRGDGGLIAISSGCRPHARLVSATQAQARWAGARRVRRAAAGGLSDTVFSGFPQGCRSRQFGAPRGRPSNPPPTAFQARILVSSLGTQSELHAVSVGPFDRARTPAVGAEAQLRDETQAAGSVLRGAGDGVARNRLRSSR